MLASKVLSCGGRPTAAAIGALLLLSPVACGGDEGSDAELANPASTYCEEQGGRVEDESSDGGERGICVLPDGSRIDEWELYRNRSTTTAEPAAPCSAAALDAEVHDDPSLPAAVSLMRADLARAAATCDYDALAALIDRDGAAVRFSWGDEVDPIAFWQAAETSDEAPRPLLALRLLLDLPAGVTDDGAGHVQYIWPAAFATDAPTDEQLREIAGTGLYDLAALRSWVAQGTNYLGYRIIVTAGGDWEAFVAGD